MNQRLNNPYLTSFSANNRNSGTASEYLLFPLNPSIFVTITVSLGNKPFQIDEEVYPN